MSRIGKLPLKINQGLSIVQNSPDSIVLKSSKGSAQLKVPKGIKVEVEGDSLRVVVDEIDHHRESRRIRSLHGLFRTLVSNSILGLTKGYSKTLELVGVGYKAAVKGETLELNLGYSHQIKYKAPAGVNLKVEKPTSIEVMGYDKALVGQVAAEIRNFRPPEPYLGKGVKYSNEVIRKKVGKSAGKK